MRLNIIPIVTVVVSVNHVCIGLIFRVRLVCFTCGIGNDLTKEKYCIAQTVILRNPQLALAKSLDLFVKINVKGRRFGKGCGFPL
jgi:hypothetical protein